MRRRAPGIGTPGAPIGLPRCPGVSGAPILAGVRRRRRPLAAKAPVTRDVPGRRFGSILLGL